MRGRDLILLVAVLLVAVFAIVDALRSDDEPRSGMPRTRVAATTVPEPSPVAKAPSDYPLGVLRGELVLAERGECRLRILQLASGFERVLPPLTGCRFSVSPSGLALAYAARGRAIFRDLAGEPGGDLGGFSNAVWPVIWSPDGRRAGWCTSSGTGLDFDVVEHQLAPRTLEHCPAVYTPNGKPAFVRGGRIFVDGTILVETRGQVLFASGAANGTIALVVATQPHPPNRLELWKGGRLIDAVEVAARLGRWPPVFGPDNCAALFRDIDQNWFEVIALDCFEAGRPDLLLFGDSADVAWSPDGRWIAVAYSDRIGFHRVSDGEEIASWPLRAAEIAWTAD